MSRIIKVFATTGFYGSGSSAVTDLLKEYDNICVKGNFEVSFFFGYHGIQNLYYWLIKGKRLQDEAIEDFLNDAYTLSRFGKKINYEKYFNNNFLLLTNKYVDKIRGDEIGEYYYSNILRMSKSKRLIWRLANKIYCIPNFVYNKTHPDVREKNIRLYGKRKKRYSYDVSEDEFNICTKEYLNNLFECAADGKDVIFLDGLIATHNVDDVSKYVDTLKLVIVKRDPRDMYLAGKYVWKTNAVPSEVNDFINWYNARMKIFTYKNSDVLEIQFEDMVFDYENTVQKIERFYGIRKEQHILVRKYFDPAVSSQNCGLWNKYINEEEAINKIKNQLNDYLYDKDLAI